MPEEVNQDVVQEVVQPTEAESQDQSPQQVNSQEHNWREARRQMSEYQRRISDLEQQIQSNRQVAQEEPEDDLSSIGQDDYLTRRQAEALALRKAQELMKQQEVATAEDRARSRYKDYDDVVTDAHIEELIKDVDVLNSLKNSQDPYTLGYKLVKQSAFYNEKSKKPSRDVDKLVKNTQKPVSSNAVQTRPLAAADAYAFGSEAERQALWKETVENARRR